MNIENFKPEGKRVFIKPFEGANQTESGLLLSASAGYATPVGGTVIMAGDESKYKIGDQIVFRRYALEELKFNTEAGEKILYLVEDEEVMAKQAVV